MNHAEHMNELAELISQWSKALGFADVGISDTDLQEHEDHLQAWLARGYHGSMDYMARHGDMRSNPDKLHPGTVRLISARMDYLPANARIRETVRQPEQAFVSRYAVGRDYHKVLRSRLGKLVSQIREYLIDHKLEGFTARPITDSAPLLEKAVAERAGLGWIGKNTLLMNKQAGSFFFLGEILTNLPLPVTDNHHENACGECRACINVCPTGAIVAPYQLDARKCISYLTIEHRDSIPVPLRRGIGNRIFGCDDCQAICPWNRYAQVTSEEDFSPRHQLDQTTLLSLFAWTENEFLSRTEGSAIRRTGYQGWLRNIAVALGNAPASTAIIKALEDKRATATPLVTEHIEWAIAEQSARLT